MIQKIGEERERTIVCSTSSDLNSHSIHSEEAVHKKVWIKKLKFILLNEQNFGIFKKSSLPLFGTSRLKHWLRAWQ